MADDLQSSERCGHSHSWWQNMYYGGRSDFRHRLCNKLSERWGVRSPFHYFATAAIYIAGPIEHELVEMEFYIRSATMASKNACTILLNGFCCKRRSCHIEVTFLVNSSFWRQATLIRNCVFHLRSRRKGPWKDLWVGNGESFAYRPENASKNILVFQLEQMESQKSNT